MCFSGDGDALLHVKRGVLIPTERFSTFIRLVFFCVTGDYFAIKIKALFRKSLDYPITGNF